MSTPFAIRIRLLASVLSVLLAAAVLATVAGWWLMRRSLPPLDGVARLPGLSAPVVVERDALGVPVIRGANRADVASALGCLHAQDRFFQMDLLRRRPAGELAELLGKSALPLDRDARVHGFRVMARRQLALLPPEQRALVDAYAAGVNAGLASLRTRPFEYYVLRVRPQPWVPEDTLLIGYAMVLDLQDTGNRYERMLAAIQNTHGRTLLDFLAPRGSALDAALDGSSFPVPPVPGPNVIDLRKRKPQAAAETGVRVTRAAMPPEHPVPGSNAFALAGSRTASGSALLANDMHLRLGVPNVWYRASLVWGDDIPGSKSPAPNSGLKTPNPELRTQHRVTGVTVPGTPLVVAGSNGRLAWGFTNSYADTADLVLIETSRIDPLLYKTGNDLVLMEDRRETIRVKGGAPVDAVSRWTIWGPVIGEGQRRQPLVLHWVFDDPEAVNFNLLALETTTDVAAALALAPTLGLPTQNLMAADHTGAIGWTLAGRLPRRVGFDGRLPTVWAYGDRRWDGFLPPGDYPRIISPSSGQVWSANQRHVGGDAYVKVGDGGYDAPARGRQVRDDLAAITAPAKPRDLLAVQLDDRALFLERWQKLLLATLPPEAVAATTDRAALRQVVAQWSGRAGVDSAAYTLVRRWRDFVADRVLTPVFEPCADADETFDFHHLRFEDPLWQLVQARPPHFLTTDYLTWDDLLLAAVDDVNRWAGAQNRPLTRLTWGARNTARIQHPFSRLLPLLLRPLLDMPAEPLPGDRDMPRVQSPTFGASERFVVSPGHEEEGIFHMPAGQSGHPLSPFYRAGHAAWVRGEPTPFLPGPAVHTLRFQP